MKRADTHNLFRSLLRAAVLVAGTAVLLASGLASCSKQDVEPATALRDGVIRLSADVVPSLQTKAPITDGSTATTKVVILGMHFLKKDGATVQTNFGGITALSGNRSSTGSISFTTAPTYDKVNDHNAYMVAYWPSKAADGASATVTPGEKVVWTADGKTDILLSTLNPSGVYDAGRYTSPRTGTLGLYHALADLRVVCKAVPTTEASLTLVQQQWGPITGVSVTNTAQTITYTYATNAVTYTDFAGFDLLSSGYESFAGASIQANTASAVSVAGMLSPLAGGRLDLVVRSQKFPSGVRVPVQLKNLQGQNCDFEAGKRYTVTLTFSANDKDIAVETTAIEPWAAGGTGGGGSNDEPLTSERIYAPSEGVIDMRYNALVRAGTSNNVSFIPALTRNSYNTYVNTQASAAGNGGYFLHSSAGLSNEKVYYKFEVAKEDRRGATWQEAWNLCKRTAPVGAWRLPRLSEIFMMYINKAELEKTPGFDSFVGPTLYVSGAEQSGGTEVLVTNFVGGSGSQPKTSIATFRCVRELDPPLPVVENYYYSDRTFSRDLHPTKTPEGVVFWVDPTNPKRFKIVSMDEPPANWEGSGNEVGKLPWSTEEVKRGLASKDNGKANTLAWMQLPNAATAYPAAKWCYTRNAGLTVPSSGITTTSADYKWYLPAKEELQHLFCACSGVASTIWINSHSFTAALGYPAAWNERFATAPLGVDYYWSSSEVNTFDNWYVHFGAGFSASAKRSSPYRVRCIREITLP